MVRLVAHFADNLGRKLDAADEADTFSTTGQGARLRLLASAFSVTPPLNPLA
jgi:hypothetical protein